MKTCLTHLKPVLLVISIVSRITGTIERKGNIGFKFLHYEKLVLMCDLLTFDINLHTILSTKYARIQVRQSSVFCCALGQLKSQEKTPPHSYVYLFLTIFNHKKTTTGINYLKTHFHVYPFLIIFNHKKQQRNKYIYINTI